MSFRTTPVDTDKLPPGIQYIIGNEAAERFSFYGMKGILTTFMMHHMLGLNGKLLNLDESTATGWYHFFVACVYGTGIFGAFLSDGLWGKYNTIMRLSLVYCLGHAALSASETWLAFAVGLSLICIGAGGIKPCVTAHVGDQFGERNKHLLDKVYSWFYFSINAGSLISTVLTPLLLEKFGPFYAFGLPGVLMLLATIVFWMGRNDFAHIPPGGARFFQDLTSAEGLKVIGRVGLVFLCIAMYWAVWDQHGSRWLPQAERMNRDVTWLGNLGFASLLDPVYLDASGQPIKLTEEEEKSLAGKAPAGTQSIRYEVLPAQVQSVNPAFILIFLPIFSYGVFPFFGRFFTVTPIRKMAAGFFIIALAWGICVAVEEVIRRGGVPHIGWQILAHFFLAASEILVSMTGLEFSYTQAPKRMKSFVLALFFVGVFLGNLFTSAVNGIDSAYLHWNNYQYFWFFQYVITGTAIFFLFVAWTFPKEPPDFDKLDNRA